MLHAQIKYLRTQSTYTIFLKNRAFSFVCAQKVLTRELSIFSKTSVEVNDINIICHHFKISPPRKKHRLRNPCNTLVFNKQGHLGILTRPMNRLENRNCEIDQPHQNLSEIRYGTGRIHAHYDRVGCRQLSRLKTTTSTTDQRNG